MPAVFIWEMCAYVYKRVNKPLLSRLLTLA